MNRLLKFYAVRYSTKKNKRASLKRQWLIPFPAASKELAKKAILQALRPDFELGEFDRYEIAYVGAFSYVSGSFVGTPTDFEDITYDVKTLLNVLNKKNEKENK